MPGSFCQSFANGHHQRTEKAGLQLIEKLFDVAANLPLVPRQKFFKCYCRAMPLLPRATPRHNSQYHPGRAMPLLMPHLHTQR